jgi:hypothetical protein
LLADAEAAEENARRTALNAEAWAEAAEGETLTDLTQDDTLAGVSLPTTVSSNDDLDEQGPQDISGMDEEGEETEELPVVRPQEAP